MESFVCERCGRSVLEDFSERGFRDADVCLDCELERKGKTMRARVHEQGNGLPDVGDYCGGGGYLYRIESIDSRIQTDGAQGNYVYCTVSEADWSDCSEGDEHSALVQLEDESDPSS